MAVAGEDCACVGGSECEGGLVGTEEDRSSVRADTQLWISTPDGQTKISPVLEAVGLGYRRY